MMIPTLENRRIRELARFLCDQDGDDPDQLVAIDRILPVTRTGHSIINMFNTGPAWYLYRSIASDAIKWMETHKDD